MSDLERYLDRVIEQKPGESPWGTRPQETTSPMAGGQGGGRDHQESPSPNVLAGVLRRWYIVLGAFVLVAVIGIPAVWIFVEPGYVVTGFIRVAPAVQDLLTGNPDTGGVGNYNQFVNTQAYSMTSPTILERVVDDLGGKNLSFFKGPSLQGNMPDRIRARLEAMSNNSGPMDRLKQAVSSGTISARSVRDTELIAVSMKSMKPQEASQIVDSFIRNYMATFAYGTTKEEEANLRLLENEKKELQDKLQQKSQQIRQLAQEYGSTTLDTRQDVMIQRVTTLLTELTRIEASRISLEADLELPDPQIASPQTGQSTDPNVVHLESMLAARNQYINSDPMIQELTRRIIGLEQELIIARESLAPENPTIKEKEKLIGAFRSRLDKTRQDIGLDFDKIVSEQRKVGSEQRKVAMVQAEKDLMDKVKERRWETQRAIERIKVHENRLKQVLSEQDAQARQVGRTSLDIQDLKFQMDLDKEMYDTVSRRIKGVEMERKRDPRIALHAKADIQGFEDKRLKYTAAVAFGALGIGGLLAFLKDKADKRLKTPQDLARQLHLPIIGTVTDSKVDQPNLLTEQLAEDFQTIRTNLGLSSGNGGIPRRLAVVSPGTQEGKTTFAVNLATSLARSGKRVLLIDGDLRKPDVAGLLGISAVAKGESHVATEDGFVYTLCPTFSAGLDVLVPIGRGHMDPYEIVVSPDLAQRISLLSQTYDHLIIDTPPVLAFPDALIWAKIAGAVVLVSFMGRTTSPDLAEAQMRLAQTRVQILGTVMNNVRQGQTYNRYRYGYYATGKGVSNQRTQQVKRRMLLPIDSMVKKEGDNKSQPRARS